MKTELQKTSQDDNSDDGCVPPFLKDCLSNDGLWWSGGLWAPWSGWPPLGLKLSEKKHTWFVSVWLLPCTDVSYAWGEMEDRAVILLPGSFEQGVMEQSAIA